MLIVILGMHRSGTSCLAGMLQRAGMYLGKDLMDAAASSNPAGHAEAWEAVRINDRLLELSGGAWDRAPRRLAGDADTAARMAAFLAELRAEPVAGWKDPRTTLTFPLWRPHLADFRVAACLRHPLAAARSLRVRDGWPLARGLRLWADYNERLLEYTADLPGIYWFDFDLPPGELRASVRAFGRQVGLAGDAGAGVFNRFLRHHQGAETLTDPAIRLLYDRLKARAQRPGVPGLPPVRPDAAACATCKELRGCLQELAWVLRAQSEVQQCQTRWQDGFRLRQAELEGLLRANGNVETPDRDECGEHFRQHGGAHTARDPSRVGLEHSLRRLRHAADRLAGQQRRLASALPVLTAAIERLSVGLECKAVSQGVRRARQLWFKRFASGLLDRLVVSTRVLNRCAARLLRAPSRSTATGGTDGARPTPRTLGEHTDRGDAATRRKHAQATVAGPILTDPAAERRPNVAGGRLRTAATV
jgi:hypothetical protein